MSLLGALGLPKPWGNTVLLLISFAVLLIGAEIFTNGIEWLGHRLEVSESATGSILAAVGTALPETIIPVMAIIQGGAQAESVGVGAILGAPFMLSTIAMFLIGVSVIFFADRRTFDRNFHFNTESTKRDLSFFLVGYSLAFGAALIRSDTISILIGLSLVGLYLLYLYQTLTSGELMGSEDIDHLHLGHLVEHGIGPIPGIGEGDHAADPGLILVAIQTLFALSVIIGGAHLFVSEIKYISIQVLHTPPAIIALLVAPLATELPEKFNSVLWISRDKDTLALGNISGAMAFQGTLPVTLGILFTSWDLSLQWGTQGFLNGFSAILAIISGGILYLRARKVGEGEMSPRPFLIGGLFYLLFILVVLYHVFFIPGFQATGGH